MQALLSYRLILSLGHTSKKSVHHLRVLKVLIVLDFCDADKRLGYAGQFFFCTSNLPLLHQ